MKLQHWFRYIGRPFQSPPASPDHQAPTIELSLQRLEDRMVLSVSGGESLLFSVGSAFDLPNGGGAVQAADIVQYDGTEFEILFDGSSAGLEAAANIDALAVAGDNQFLLSFAAATEVPGLGTVGASDLILFEADSLGFDNTSGTFSLFVSGADLGLNTTNGNISAVDLLDDGSLVISTLLEVTLPAGQDGADITVARQDLVQITPDAAGSYANGTWQFLFDGSDVGVNSSTENIDGVSMNGLQIRLSTLGGNFIDPQGISGSREDVLTFTGIQLGEETLGTFAGVTFDGNVEAGLLVNLNAFDYANISNPSNPPTAEDFHVELEEDSPVEVQLLGDDGDPNAEQTLTYQIVDSPNFGVATNFDPSTGTFTYVPNSNFHGVDQLIYIVQEVDENGVVLTSELAVVSFTVTPVNDAPVVILAQTEVTGKEDLPVSIQGIMLRDVEAEAQHHPVTVTLRAADGVVLLQGSDPGVQISGNGTGEVTLIGGIAEINLLLSQGVTFQPDLNFSGQTSLEVTIVDDQDPETALSTTRQVQIEIQSTQEQITAIENRISQLVNSGELQKGHGQALLNTLKPNKNDGQIEHALKLIDQWEKVGRIDPEVAQELRDQLNDLLEGTTTGDASQVDVLFSQLGSGQVTVRSRR